MLLRIFSFVLACGVLAAGTAPEWDAAALTKWVEMMHLSRRQLQNGKYEESRNTLTAALKLVTPHESRRPAQGVTLNNLGDIHDELGRFREAEQYYKRSIAIWESLGEEGHEALSRPLNNLALLYTKMGRRAEAHRLYLRSLTIRTELKGPADLDLAPVLNHLCESEALMRRFSEAEARCQRAIAIVESAGLTVNPALPQSYINLAALYRLKGDLSTAAEWSEKALKTAAETPGVRQSMMINMLLVAIRIRLEQDSREEAAELLHRAESMARQYLSPAHPVFATIYFFQAKLMRSDNRKAVAQQLEERAAEILSSHRRENAMESVVDVSEFRR